MSELAEIRGLLFDMKEDMGAMRSDVASLKERGTKVDDLEKRTRSLESYKDQTVGRQSVISVIVSTAVAGLVTWATKHFA